MTEQAWQGRDASRDRWRGPRRALLAAAVLVVMIITALRFTEGRKPQSARAEMAAPRVAVQKVAVRDTPVVIRGCGVVAPCVEVDLMPEVTGRVTFVHSELRKGGVIRAGEKIIRIDPRDYELVVQQARAAVAEAQAHLDLRTTEADVMRRLNPEEPNSPRILSEPQVREARAALESARIRLTRAELQLERTALSLPFDALIVARQIDLGQYVTAGQPLAKAYGIETFRVEVPLAEEDLASLDRPETLLPTSGSASEANRIATVVKATFAGREYTWQGFMVGTTGQVDRAARTIPVVVEIPGPLDADGGNPSLLPGTAVEVLLPGKPWEAAVAVPGPPDL